jgi:hypothetical protein
MRSTFARAVVAMVVVAVAGCEKTDHENIDKWMGTKKGPGKLMKALQDGSIDPDLSAHAGENLIRRGQATDAITAIQAMSPERAAAVVGKLAPRLWERARVEQADAQPSPSQITAKDALFDIRKLGDDAARTQIDGYLLDWYASNQFYEQRATLGRHLGIQVMRAIGPPAGEKLKSVANSIVAKGVENNMRDKIGDELLLALAASGNADAVKYTLEIAKMDRGDPTLSERALSAIYRAYVDNGGLFPVADAAALGPNVDLFVSIAKDENNSNQTVNDAVSLIRQVGPPKCFDALLGLVNFPHSNPKYRLVLANNTIKCGGAKAIAPVARALPAQAYDHAELRGYIWDELARVSPKADAQAALRDLLADKSWVARWVAMEALAIVKAKEDIERIQRLSGDGARLVGYWAGRDGKKDPTLGERAKAVVAALQAGKDPAEPKPE